MPQLGANMKPQEFAHNAADIMLGDIAAWRLLTARRHLTIPG